MKNHSLLKRAGASALAVALGASCAMPAFAATTQNSSASATNNTATTNDLANSDIIDYAKKGSLSIYKYDLTSALQDAADGKNGMTGFNTSMFESTGTQNADAERMLAGYVIKGVEFTYLRVGAIETYSTNKSGTNEAVNVVYEIDKDLADILGLTEAEAYKMTAQEPVSQTCDTGKLHYSSQQLNDALANVLANGTKVADGNEYNDGNDAEYGHQFDGPENTINALQNYIKNHGGTAMPLTDAQGHTSADGLDLGLYLVVETKVPEEVTDTVNPWFASLPFTDQDNGTAGTRWLYDMTCYPKNQTGNPTLDKLVRNAYSNSDSFKDKNGTVDSATTFEGFTGKNGLTVGVKNNDKTPIVHNLETMVKADDTDDASYVANRGGYTEDGITAGPSVYSSDYTYASTTTASEGDILDYILVSKMPKITTEATYLSQYTFDDVLAEGIEYNDDVRIAFYNSQADAVVNNTANAIDIWDIGAGKHDQNYAAVTVNNVDSGKTSLKVSMTADGLAEINKKYDDQEYMVVFYTATVNSDATAVLGDTGNANDVKLTWERTSAGYYDTLEDECIVYTYGLDITKTFSDGKGDATKVQFKLYNNTDAYYVVASQKAADGVYYVSGKAASEDDATVFVPAADGTLKIFGLEADSYGLTEIATDKGYSLLRDQITINITSAERDITAAVAGRINWANTDIDAENGHGNQGEGRTTGKTAMVIGDLTSGVATVDTLAATMADDATGSHNAIVNIGITNNTTFQLPLTGGDGLYVITIMGVVVVAAGCFFVCRHASKRKAH